MCGRRFLEGMGVPAGCSRIRESARVDPMGATGSMEELRRRLPRQAAVLDSLAHIVAREDRWRWLQYGCSLGAGGGDGWSDIDAAVGYRDIAAGELFDAARAIAVDAAEVIDLVVHRMDGWP